MPDTSPTIEPPIKPDPSRKWGSKDELTQLHRDLVLAEPALYQVDSTLSLIQKMHRESPKAHRPLHLDHIRKLIEEPQLGQKIYIMYHKADTHRIIGFIAGYIVEHPLYQERSAQDWAMYVRPQWRGLRLSKRLIFAFEGWARRNGCHSVNLGVLSGNPRGIRAIIRAGYKQLPGVVLNRDITKTRDCRPAGQVRGGF